MTKTSMQPFQYHFEQNTNALSGYSIAGKVDRQSRGCRFEEGGEFEYRSGECFKRGSDVDIGSLGIVRFDMIANWSTGR